MLIESRYRNINFRQNVSFSLKNEKQLKGQRGGLLIKKCNAPKEMNFFEFSLTKNIAWNI